jgi:methionyl-tRNA formyltransferase
MTYKFAYFGTPYVARDTLALLIDRGFTPAVVITSPDAPRGRGMELTPCETKVFATERNLPILTPERIDDATTEAIRTYGCDFAIVVAYGKILPQSLIDAFPMGVINIHYSLLPKYRGASPVEAALLHGDTVTGVSIQKMAFELDAGDILAQREVSIEPNETTHELRPRLVTIGAELLAEILPSFASGTLTPKPQDPSQATRAKKIQKEEGLLTLPGNDSENWNKYRAYAEGPGTYFFVQKNGKEIRVKITKASFANGKFVIERVVPEGKREMAYADFSRV